MVGFWANDKSNTQAKRRKKADEIKWREITNEEEMLEWRQKEDGKKKTDKRSVEGTET